MRAWYYYRGQLEFIPGEHPGVIGRVAKGAVRLRYHEDRNVLAAQGRSRDLVRRAVACVLDRTDITPNAIEAEWPGHWGEFAPWEF